MRFPTTTMGLTILAAVDPARPTEGRLKPLGGHGEDELGQLVGSFNALLVAFQRGLDGREDLQAFLEKLYGG